MSVMPRIPEIPTFRRMQSIDGKTRLYLVASNKGDIELMIRLSSLRVEGIRRLDNDFLDGYFRVIKNWEEKIIKKVFP